MTRPVRKLFVKTYGCQMNVYDSERMTAALAAQGYEATVAAEDADLILLNTCHIREKAAEKVYSELGRLRRLREHRRACGVDMLAKTAAGNKESRDICEPAIDFDELRAVTHVVLSSRAHPALNAGQMWRG